LRYYFNSPYFQKYTKEKQTGSAIPNLGLKAIRDFSINLPTLPEQVEIVRILDIIIEKENKAKQAAEAVLEQIDLLKKSILARAFRGEL
jgi:type I restriction enzyme S subunit